jgi:iron(II)-dependent oxidoreductase
VATVTFRNWDLPQRRQIFAGLRLATDGEDTT